MEPSGGVGKAAAELIKEMQQAQQELEQAQNKTSSTGGASFKDAMQAQAPQGPQAPQGYKHLKPCRLQKRHKTYCFRPKSIPRIKWQHLVQSVKPRPQKTHSFAI